MMSNPEQASITQQLRDDYTTYYHEEIADSPIESREDIAHRVASRVKTLLASGHSKVYLLDVGSGRQAVFSLICDQLSVEEANRVQCASIDIAELGEDQLPFPKHHAIANGLHLPFASQQFDIVMSNLAADFMDRGVFKEISRLLSAQGYFELNLHHPDIIRMAEIRRQELAISMAKVRRELTQFPRSSRAPKRRQKLARLEQEMTDVNFIINQGPTLLFQSEEEVLAFLSTIFSDFQIEIKTQKSERCTSNSWFSVSVSPL